MGSIVCSRAARKIRYLDDRIAYCSAGTSSHNMFIGRWVKGHVQSLKYVLYLI